MKARIVLQCKNRSYKTEFREVDEKSYEDLLGIGREFADGKLKGLNLIVDNKQHFFPKKKYYLNLYL